MKRIILLAFSIMFFAEMSKAQPVGTIVAFGGSKDRLPAGWLVCDGRDYDRIGVYKPLFDAIGTTWGGDGANRFNVPDLQGLFLRGWSDQSGVDPDAPFRTNSRPGLANPGAGQNAVGSKQGDTFTSHTHDWMSGTGWAEPRDGGNRFPVARNEAGFEHAGPSQRQGGNETRPKNAYVLYIIKYQ